VVAPFRSVDRVPSARIVCVCEDTLKKEDELVASVVVPEGRLGNSLSLSLSLSFSFSFSADFGRSLVPRPNDNLDDFLTIDLRGGVASLDPEEACLR